MDKNVNDSILKTMYTDEELAAMNFTQEEYDALEYGAALSSAADTLPDSKKDMDALLEKFDKTFPLTTDMEGTYNNFMKLCETDPEFVTQVLAMSVLVDEVEEVPPPKTEKVSVDELVSEKNIQKEKSDKEKLDKLMWVLENMPEDFDPNKMGE